MIRTLSTSILGIAAGLVLLVGASAPVSAEEEDAPADATPTAEASTETVEGLDPEAERDGRPVGYYIGRTEDGGISLRSHGPNARHHFTAVLRTNGRFVDVEAVRLELGDWVRVSDDGHTLRYNVHTFDGLDGVNFRIEGGDVVTFRLELNDRLIGTDHIYLGAADSHPAHNPFRIRL